MSANDPTRTSGANVIQFIDTPLSLIGPAHFSISDASAWHESGDLNRLLWRWVSAGNRTFRRLCGRNGESVSNL